MVSEPSHGQRKNIFLEYIERRFPVAEAMHLAEKKKVPLHKHSSWYYLGGIAGILFLVQAVTGILLMVYYVPEINSAHASILKINSVVNFGWFIRSLHSWSANLMIFVVIMHLFSTFFMKAYRFPREMTWLTGLVMMVICLAFGFTGYLLPWDDVSFFATKIGLDVASKTPVLGNLLALTLRGGETISQATISRFFVIHVALLPVLSALVLGAHMLFIQLNGISEPAFFKKLPEGSRKYEKFFPDFFFKDILVWILAVNVLFVLTMLCPWSVGPEADPFAAAPIGIKPEWYFLAPFQFLKLLPPMIGPIEGELFGIILMALVGLGFVFVPFFDSGASETKSKLSTAFGVLVLLALIVFTVWGAAS